MSKNRKSRFVEAIFKEIEIYNNLLVKYESMEEPLLDTKENWRIPDHKQIQTTIYILEMENKINIHLKKLIFLLDKVIKGDPVKCKVCSKTLSIQRLITNPGANICLTCRLKPIKVENRKFPR